MSPETGQRATNQRGEASPVEQARSLNIPRSVTVGQLATLVKVSPVEVIKNLMRVGIMATINDAIDHETAAKIAQAYGFQTAEPAATAKETPPTEPQRKTTARKEKPPPRPPVVCVLGHVDHGKTTLLDAIRQTNVALSEVGGITQHIGAYQVEVNGQRVTFLDTPGHEAFTSLRARGARATDIGVLVVGADDGVMPQTLEAIDHVKAAGVPLIVAINKIDLPTANADRVKQQLSQHGVLVEDWGGDTIAVPVSAKTKQGLADLLAAILLVAEVGELTADPDRPARGVVLEARLDPTRGPMATLLVQEGTLRPGDAVLASEAAGRIRAMLGQSGERLQQAGPSTPVAILGLDEVPRSGDAFAVVEDDKTAKERAEQRRRERSASGEARPSTLERLMGQIRAGEVQELNVIVKADVQGSLEAIRLSLERMATDRAQVNIIHAATGTVTENDVLLAAASKALILGFSTRVEPLARRVAASEGVDIRTYAIIYELISDVERALRGLLPTQYRQVLDGKAEVRQIFDLRRGKIAGCQVVEGRIRRGAQARLLRQGKVLSESTIASLRHFRDEAREMAAGQECGIGLEGFDDFQAGDVIEAYRQEEVS